MSDCVPTARRWFFAAVAAAVVTFSSPARAVEAVNEDVDETYPLDADATISIQNIDGSIRIYAADVNEVHMHALKRAYTAERLKEITVEAKATQKSLTIETHVPPRQASWKAGDRSGTVDYTLIVPMTANVTRCDLVNGEILIEGLQGGAAKAHLVNGWLAAHNSFADVDVSIVNGTLDVAYDWWQSEKKFTANASSVNGNIRALIAPDASAAITATSEQGRVANSFADEDEPKGNTRNVTVAIGTGDGAAINLHAANGNIRIDKSYEAAASQ